MVTRRFAGGWSPTVAAEDAADDAAVEEGGRVGENDRLVATTGGGTVGGFGKGLDCGFGLGATTLLVPAICTGFSWSTSGRVATVSESQELQEPRKFSAPKLGSPHRVGFVAIAIRGIKDASTPHHVNGVLRTTSKLSLAT